MKNCDKKSIAEIKKILNAPVHGAQAVGTQILDNVLKFVTGRENATFANDGEEIFASVDTFSKAIKKADPSQLEKSYI